MARLGQAGFWRRTLPYVGDRTGIIVTHNDVCQWTTRRLRVSDFTKTRWFLRLFVLMLLLSAYTFGQTKTPQFKDYPALGRYAGKNAAVVITAQDRMYRTRLKEAAREKPNFAGHYILTAWGCGTECLMGAVIDANTGKVYWFPHAICCWNGVERDDNFTPIVFRPNSRLVVFTGARNEQEGDEGVHFYTFGARGFKHIRTVKSTKTQSTR